MSNPILHLIAVAAVLNPLASAQAQGVGDVGRTTTGQQSRPCYSGATSPPCGRAGGTATTGTGVKTGKGPLTQPIPPAVSTSNPPHNPQLPQNMQGPVHTNPPKEPFGSR
jgi:hypothetical protein